MFSFEGMWKLSEIEMMNVIESCSWIFFCCFWFVLTSNSAQQWLPYVSGLSPLVVWYLSSVEGNFSFPESSIYQNKQTKTTTTTTKQTLGLFLLIYFWYRISLYSSGCPGNHSVNQAGLELTDSFAWISSAGITGMHHHCLSKTFISKNQSLMIIAWFMHWVIHFWIRLIPPLLLE